MPGRGRQPDRVPATMSRRRHRRWVGVALVGVVVARGAPAAAQRLTDFTQEELHTLPRLCLAQQFINQELDPPLVPESERAQLLKQLGHSYVHYHHYCWALLDRRRAAAPGGDKFNYHRAVANLDYVIRNVDPVFAFLTDPYFEKGNLELLFAVVADVHYGKVSPRDPRFALLPDVFFEKGSILEELGQHEAAVIEYQNALRARADYTPAYAALVQMYLDRGDVDTARATLTEGLKHDPRSTTLAEEQSALAKRQTETR